MTFVPLAFVAVAFADDPVEAWASEKLGKDVVPGPVVAETGLHFLGISDTKLTVNNIATTTPLVNGQIVGELGGTNATVVQAEAAEAVEQRLIGIFSYSPKLLDGKATLTAGFRVQFAWGDSSYGIGGNTGGGFGGEQVNLQTKRLHGRYQLWDHTSVVAGLQFVGDGVNDPERSTLDQLTRSGGKLLFFGTEAAGVTAYGEALHRHAQFKVGGYTLAEDAFAEPDDITLWMGDGQVRLAYATTLGAHLWYLRDRAGGSGGFYGTGPTSALSELQGGPHLTLGPDAPDTSAALGWAGLDFGYNPGLDKGRVGATAMVVSNFGRLYVTDEPDVSVLGFVGDAEARVRYAPGAGSVVRAEVIAVSGSDGNEAETGRYTGVITGNSYGVAATAWSTHGCMLLFPDTNSINRQVADTYDISGAGAGLLAGMGQAGYDIVPNRLTAAVGAGAAKRGDDPTVVEANARVSGHPFPLATWGAYGGVLLDPAAERPAWTVYTAFDWVVF